MTKPETSYVTSGNKYEKEEEDNMKPSPEDSQQPFLYADNKEQFEEIKDNNDAVPYHISAANKLNGDKNASPSIDKVEMHLSKWSIWKNVMVVTLAFVFLFSAFMSFCNLQSTVNMEAGLGTTGLALIYVAMIVSGLFLPPITMSKFSYKWVMVVSMATYLGYLATGYYATWSTVIPGSIVLGIGASHLWTAKQAYLTQLAGQYAIVTKSTEKKAIDLFLGIFYGSFFTTQIWGNLISSLVFSQGQGNETSAGSDITSLCGANLCPSDATMEKNVTIIHAPDAMNLTIFTSFCIGLGLVAVAAMCLLLTNVPSPPRSRDPVCSKLLDVVRHVIMSRDQQLLIFPTILRGMSQAFIMGEYTAAYVSCPLGVQYVGFVMIAYGVSSSAFTLLFGKLSKCLHHAHLFIIAFCVQVPVIVTLFLWQPDDQYPSIMFVLAALWAVGDAVYSPTVAGLYSHMFKDNITVALSCFRLVDAVGWAVSFIYSHALCVRYKLVIVSSILVLTVISIILQAVLHRRQKQHATSTSEK